MSKSRGIPSVLGVQNAEMKMRNQTVFFVPSIFQTRNGKQFEYSKLNFDKLFYLLIVLLSNLLSEKL